MTLCIAALADNRQTIIMAADRLISVRFIESELETSKIMPIHENWWALIAANALPNVFPIIDKMKDRWPQTAVDVEVVAQLVTASYQEERRTRAEAVYLLPRGLTTETFLANGRQWLPEITFRELDSLLSGYDLGVELLICGFDRGGAGHIFTVNNPGIRERRDIPGFHAIGSGFYGAQYMMYYRELSFLTPSDEWLYYIYEAKAFGEQAGAVGNETEILVAKAGQVAYRIDKDGFQATLDRLWSQMAPKWLDGRQKRSLKNLLKSTKPEPASQSEPSGNEP